VHRVERLFAWLGGALFVGALALAGWWYAVFLNRVRAGVSWPALVFDATLFSIFAGHHSLFARPAVKTAMGRVVPERLLRSVYVWTASLLLMIVCLVWQPVGGVAFAHGGFVALLHVAVQISGLVLIALSVRVIGAARMTGDRLAFAVISSAYLVVAIPWEEASLRRLFGGGYERYARLVRWRIAPGIW
jgi:hypothetical protein